MAVSIIISNDMWNDKNNAPAVSSYDQVEAYVHFDQPIVHELEYIEQNVTNFWLTLSLNGVSISTLMANKVLPELMDEAKMFKNGKFKFSISKLPDAATQHFHAAFAQHMSELPEEKYSVQATFHTDNPLQKNQVLATVTFEFVVEPGSKEHLLKIVAENLANGADKSDDASAKLEKFATMNQTSEKHAEVMVTFVNKGSSEIWVMAGYKTGRKFSIPYQQSNTLAVPAGTEFFKAVGEDCSTNFGIVSGKRKEETIEVY